MSDLRIALVAEGTTDQIIIEAALKAILPTPFVLTLLQPEPTRPKMGGGWGGVFKWCSDFRRQGYAALEDDPRLSLFDLFIVHLDADVADKSYADCGETVVQAAVGLLALPCAMPCPPPSNSVNQLKHVLLGWLGMNATGVRTVLCIPSKASEAWLAAAVFPGNDDLLTSVECEMNMEGILVHLPTAQRIRKARREYLTHAPAVTTGWAGVTLRCSQARLFHQDVDSIAQTLPA